MAITDITNPDRTELSILVEMYVSVDLNKRGWPWVNSLGNVYEKVIANIDGDPDYEYLEVWGDGTYLTWVASPGVVFSTSNSFFYDVTTGFMYVNLAGTDPNDISIIGSCWLPFCNRQSDNTDDKIIFSPGSSTVDVPYIPCIPSNGIPSLTESLGQFYTEQIRTGFGSVKFSDTGWFLENRRNYIFHNKKLIVKVGEIGMIYSKYTELFTGVIQNPSFKFSGIVFGLKDVRSSELRDLPPKTFNITDYPEIEDDALNAPLPLLFGQKLNVPLIRMSTGEPIHYKICQTSFDTLIGGTDAVAISAINAVYIDGVFLNNTEYIPDLTNAGIYLNEPLDDDQAFVTADVKGSLAGCNFALSDPLIDTYTDNVADILFFILNVVLKIPVARINKTDFAALQLKRTQKIGFFIDKVTKMSEVIRRLQSSATFHLYPDPEGIYKVIFFDNIDPVQREYLDPDVDIIEETEGVKNKVVLYYDRDVPNNTWKTVETINPNILEKYGVENAVLTVDTYLTNATEAQNACDYFADLVKEPPDKIIIRNRGIEDFDLIPSHKVKITRSFSANGRVLTDLDSVEYALLQVTKHASRAQANFLAIKSSQAQGEGSHADTAHQDSYLDDYSEDHSDGAHGDYSEGSHSNTHSDTAHEDVAHEDTAHGDTEHVNVIHEDYADAEHEDTPHGDTAHSDQVHEDVAHENVVHVNTSHNDYTDSHTNTAHTDDHTNDHSDVHSDLEHVDSET